MNRKNRDVTYGGLDGYSAIFACQFVAHLSQSVRWVAALTTAAWFAFLVGPKGILA